MSLNLELSSISPSLTVNDLEKSRAFYVDVLGFKVQERFEPEGKLVGYGMLAGNVFFMIGQDDWQKGRDRKKGEGVRLYFGTKQSIDEVASGIKARGGALEYEPRDEPWGARAFALVDPDGYKITFMSEMAPQ